MQRLFAADAKGRLTTPGDLGYWFGYRIVKSYCEHATDKRRALSTIIELKDAKVFLAKSGWHSWNSA